MSLVRRRLGGAGLEVQGNEAKRGARLKISGRVEADGNPCAEVRVDLFLEPRKQGRERIQLGAMVTGEEWRYDGRVVLPFSVLPGDYDVRATTPGNLACGQGQSQ